MSCKLEILLGSLFVALAVHATAQAADGTRSASVITTDPAPMALIKEPIDWEQSAGIFIGIERFRSAVDRPVDVRYAAEDATGLAYLFTTDLKRRLPLDRTLIVLAGEPRKASSQARLAELQRKANVILDGEKTPVDADMLYALVSQYAKKVGPNGILILFTATHGFTNREEHVLMTPDSSTSLPRGVTLVRLLEAIPPGHANRLLMFVDACREHLEKGVRGTPATAMPPGLLENLRFPGGYAILVASEPKGYAYWDDSLQNGFFTAAVMDGLRCHAPAGSDGYITPSTLEAFVSKDVRARSGGRQRPEGRFGGLADLPLVPCGDERRVASILMPLPNAAVNPNGVVDVRIFEPGLYMTALVCAVSNNRCFNQTLDPLLTPANEVTRVAVQYGEQGAFRVYVALTCDSKFLRRQKSFETVPFDTRADRIVYWLGPVPVSLEDQPDAASVAGNDRPKITYPPNAYKTGEIRMEAAGSIPKGTFPFFGVEPMKESSRIWIQPRIHGAAGDGSVSGTVNFGDEENGAGENFKIYLLACADQNALTAGQIIRNIPKGCVGSSPVEVHRLP
jgi:hypothetical protein